MKKGSGDDPFADLEEPTNEGEPASDGDDSTSDGDDAARDPQGSTGEDGAAGDSTMESSPSTTERYTERSGSGAGRDDPESASNDGASAATAGSTGNAGQTKAEADNAGQTKAEADGIPWVLRRSRVKEDRENVHQFFLREEYSAREDEIIEAVASELGMRQKDLQKLDVREAMVAAADPEDVAAVLRDWGYEYLK